MSTSSTVDGAGRSANHTFGRRVPAREQRFADLPRGPKLVLAAVLTAACSATFGVVAAPSSLAAFRGGNGLIAFESNRDGGNYEIYTMNADGTQQTNVTNNPAGDAEPAWSPDGRKIAFASTRDGNAEIYVMDADGSEPVRLTNNGATDIFPSWSPDGAKITWASFSSDYDVWVMNADGTDQVNITNDPAEDIFPVLAAERFQDSFPNEPRRQCGDLRDERGRQRPDQRQQQPSHRGESAGLVTRRSADRLCRQHDRGVRHSRHECRRERRHEGGRHAVGQHACLVA